jgi:hypothetical protein
MVVTSQNAVQVAEKNVTVFCERTINISEDSFALYISQGDASQGSYSTTIAARVFSNPIAWIARNRFRYKLILSLAGRQLHPRQHDRTDHIIYSAIRFRISPRIGKIRQVIDPSSTVGGQKEEVCYLKLSGVVRQDQLCYNKPIATVATVSR